VPKLTIAEQMLTNNDAVAAEVRARLAAKGLRALNLMSAPGAGKTTLLERTIARLRGRLTLGVIEGDVMTSADAERIERAGAQSVQINTRGACHLEAHMVRAALEQMEMTGLDLVCIENIGNLVCPATWNLGEDARCVVISVAEGDDKPAKYPEMFAVAQVMVINKTDLLPYVDFDLEKVRAQALAINPRLRIFEVSCRTDAGLDAWCDWLAGFARGGLTPAAAATASTVAETAEGR
jgi:hydrogenase nickel incorporation protein HypB